MGERWRRWSLPALMLALVAVIGVGLATATPPAGDRVEELAGQLRCPVCQGESVADSPSDTASAIEQQIVEMVAAGRSDEEVLDHFVARYGRWVLLDPPLRGDTLLLWVLPPLALVAGAAVVLTRRRATRDAPAGATGLVPADASAAVRAPAMLEHTPQAPSDDRSGPRRGGVAVAASVAAIVAVAVSVALPRFLDQRPTGGFVTGNEAVDGPDRELSDVTNEELEQVVAANPDVVEMRLRLAQRYLDGGESSKAIDHYMAVLDREPHPEALAQLGWLVFNDDRNEGRVEVAYELLEASRQRVPDDPRTLWFLANVELHGRDDPDAALQLLEQLALRDDLGQQRARVEQLIDEARSRKAAP